MQFINLTGHEVVLLDEENNPAHIFPPSGMQARCDAENIHVGYHDGIEIVRKKFSAANVPEPQAGVMFIVSQIVLNAAHDRNDLCIPGETVKNASGQIIGCKSICVK